MANTQEQNSQSIAWYLTWLRNLGIAVFALASVIALILLWIQGAGLLQKFWMIVGWLVACGAVTLSFLTTVRARDDDKAVIPATVIFDAVCFIVGGLVIVSFGSASDPFRWSAAMIWSFACLALGALMGFLFGIPRSRSGRTGPAATRKAAGNGHPEGKPQNSGNGKNGDPGDKNAKSQQVERNANDPAAQKQPGGATVTGSNAQAGADSGAGIQSAANGQGAGNGNVPSNAGDGQPENNDAGQNDGESSSGASAGDESPIEQISDWLTKIIVGLGLANLKDLPHQLDLWAHYVAGSLGQSQGETAAAAAAAIPWGPSFALGLIIYFLVLGFLSCYILTQMFLLNFINRMRATSQR